LTPAERYIADLNKASFQPDKSQRLAVEHTQHLYEELSGQETRPGLFARLFNTRRTVRGLYLWGGTGRGKTYLVDSFYECLPFEEKYRTHFHNFMRDTHTRMQNLPRTPDPLVIVAKDLASKIRVLCLDEFHVHDIGDAMVMSGLLRAIIENGITLVTTSNIAIHDLYKDGLQRERFLGAIDLLAEHTCEINLGDGTDYRFQVLEKNGTYKVIENANGDEFLQQHLDAIAPCTPKHNRAIVINDRQINYVAHADDVIWFDFDAICNTPRSASDYIQIAELHHTVLISNIRQMTEEQDNIAKRLIHLIDALYDHRVKVIITATNAADDLYSGRLLAKAFERTVSRLVEMDDKEYLAQPHNDCKNL